jgi:tail length tape measure protein
MATTLNVIKTLTIRGSAEGVGQVEQELRKLQGSIEGVTLASEEQTKATLSTEAALNKLQLRYDQAYRAQQALANVQKTLTAAQNQGLISQQQASELMQNAIKQHNTLTPAVDNYAKSNKAARYELLNLSRQLQDVFVGLASGQRFFTVAIQQGTQIGDAFQTASLAGRSLGAQIISLITPMRVLLGVTGLVAAAAYFLYQAWKSVETQFLNLSERLNVPIQKLHELEAAASIKGISTDEFTKSMENFGDAVELAKRDLGEMGELFRLNGIRAKDTIDAFEKFADLVKNARIEDRFSIAKIGGFGTAEGVRFLSQGAEGIRKAAAEATKFGTGVDEDMIKKAREFDEAWNLSWKQFSLGWRSIFVEVIEGMKTWLDKAAELLRLANTGGTGTGFATAADEQKLIELGQRRAREMGLLGPPSAESGGGPTARITVTPQDLQANERDVSLLRQRIGLLGELATVQEKVTLKEDEVALARRQGVKLSDDEAKSIRDVAEAQEKANKSARTIAALGDAATTMEKYKAAIDAANVALKDGTLTQEQYNRKVFELNPVVSKLSDAIGELGSDLAKAFINGANAADALNASLKAIASTAASEAIKNLIKGDIVGAGISGAVAGVAALGSLLFGGGNDSQAQQQAAQAQQQAAQAAAQAAEAVAQAGDALKALADDMKGPFQQKLEAGQKAFDDLKDKVDAGKQSLVAYAQQVGFGTPAAMAAAAAFADLNRRLEEGKENLEAFTNQLRDDFNAELTRQEREVSGQGFLNTFQDLRNTRDQQLRDAQALGLDETDRINNLFFAQAQKQIDTLKLTGAQFIQLLVTFPELVGHVHEFNAAVDVVKRSVDELARASESLDDRMLAATTDANTLEGALALFDRRAQREREEEVRQGGENLVQLEAVQAAERLQVIEQFNERSIELERERADQLNSIARDIATYVNSLFAGPESALSPFDRLQQAQSAYNAQLALAQGGNTDALSTITKFAEDLRQAGLAFFGSSTNYQTLVGTIAQQLVNLPAVSGSTDPVVQALVNTVTPAIQATTGAVGGTTSAVNSQTTTQSAEALTQANLLTAANNLSTSANNLATSTNNLITSTNNLVTSTNAILTAIQGLNSTANSTLDAINTNTGILLSSENNLDQIKTSTSQLPSIKSDTGSINSHTSHMFAPSGSINFNLQGGGVVPDGPVGNVIPFRRAGGGPIGTDIVPGWLSPGEFVVNRSVAKSNYAGLAQLNATGVFPGSDNALSRIEMILAKIAEIEERGNAAIETNTMATLGQTRSLNRESRFAARSQRA